MHSQRVRVGRWTCGAAVIAIFLLGFPRRLRASPKDYAVRELAPNTFVWIPEDVVDQNGDPQFSRAANAGFIISDDGVVVVDTTNNPFHARELLYEIRQRTGIPVRLVIDAGPQGDQILGNEVFAEQRATILSTAAAAAQMRDYDQQLLHRLSFDPLLALHMRGVHITLPDRTIQATTTFSIGGEEIRMVSLHCALSGQKEGNAAVFLPAVRVAFLGDLYVNGYIPRMDSLDIRQWITVLREVEGWNAAVYVPAHGSPGTKADLEHFRGFLEWLQGRVQGGIREGKSLTDVERELLDTKALYLRAPELGPSTIADVYRQLLNSTGSRHLRSNGASATAAGRLGYKLPISKQSYAGVHRH